LLKDERCAAAEWVAAVCLMHRSTHNALRFTAEIAKPVPALTA
jgi:hypothetical protein